MTILELLIEARRKVGVVVALLDKGWLPEDDYDEICRRYGSLEDVPEKVDTYGN